MVHWSQWCGFPCHVMQNSFVSPMRSTAFQGTGADEPVLQGRALLSCGACDEGHGELASETEFLRALEARFRVPCASPGHFLGPDQKFRHCQLKPQDFSADLQTEDHQNCRTQNGFCRVRRFWQHTNKHSCAHVFVEPHTGWWWRPLGRSSGYRCGLQDTIDLVAMLGVKRFPEVSRGLLWNVWHQALPLNQLLPAVVEKIREGVYECSCVMYRDISECGHLLAILSRGKSSVLEGARRKRGHRGRTGNRWK